MKGEISVHELARDFGSLRAVNQVSFNVSPGEFFGFLGPNGAGKTTTIKILCTLLRPTSGRATVSGWDVSKNPHDTRKSIGVVFQEPTLDDRLTARENLLFHAMIYGVPSSVRKNRIQQLLEVVGLADRSDDLVRTFSGGMRRRLELARGLMHEPSVLFLDEPTVGLDPQTRSRIWDLIRAMQKERGVTVFLTTHSMEEAEGCDRVAIMDHGKIIALDTPDKLKSNLGKEVVSIQTDQPDDVRKTLETVAPAQILSFEGRLEIQTADAGVYIARALPNVRARMQSVSIHKPTLEDVFLHLTGRTIREESADPYAHLRMIHHSRQRQSE